MPKDGLVDCVVCDDMHTVALRTGAQADLFPCPACVGLDPETLDGWAKEDAEAACAEEGVPVKWLPALPKGKDQ